MKKVLIILLLPVFAKSQLSTNQKAQVTTMIATAVKVPNDKIAAQTLIINKLISDTLLKSKTILSLSKKIDSLTVMLDQNIFLITNKVITIPVIQNINDRLSKLENPQTIPTILKAQ